MSNWYLFSIVVLLLFGLQRFLYKVSAEKNCNSAITTFAFMGTVTVLSSSLFLVRPETIDHGSALLAVSFINSLSFSAATMCTMEALKRLPASLAMPLIRLNIALVVLSGILFFGDRPSPAQSLGIALCLAVVLLLARGSTDGAGGPRKRLHGFIFVAGALVAGALAALSSAWAALHVNKLAFIALSYGLGTIIAIATHRTLGGSSEKGNTAPALCIGICIGLINFGGFYALLLALADGPVSIIIPFTGLSFVVAVLLSVLIYGETLDRNRLAALLLTIAAVVMMRF